MPRSCASRTARWPACPRSCSCADRGTEVCSRPIKGTRRPAGRGPGRATAARRAAALGQGPGRERDDRRPDAQRPEPGLPARQRARSPRCCAPRRTQGCGTWSRTCAARCRPVGDGPLVAAAFPPGSVTGAPKVRALEIIHELEATPREVYTGAIGYRSPVAGLELNVAIRTFEFAAGRVWLGSGGGITARSVDAAEYRECLVKAGPLIRALGGQLPPKRRPARPACRAAGRLSAPALRPRPAVGVFTSLRVTDGAAPRPGPRIWPGWTESSRELFGKRLPPGLRSRADRAAGRAAIGTAADHGPAGGRAAPGQASRWCRLAAALDTVALHPVTVPGGLGGAQVGATAACWPAWPGRPVSARTGSCSSRTATARCWRPTGPTCSRCSRACWSPRPPTAGCCPASPGPRSCGWPAAHGLTASETPVTREQLPAGQRGVRHQLGARRRSGPVPGRQPRRPGASGRSTSRLRRRRWRTGRPAHRPRSQAARPGHAGCSAADRRAGPAEPAR